MKRNLEKLILNTEIIYRSNLLLHRDREYITEYLTEPFKTELSNSYNKEGSCVYIVSLRLNDFLKIVTNFYSGMLPDEIHLLFEELRRVNNCRNIWIGLD